MNRFCIHFPQQNNNHGTSSSDSSSQRSESPSPPSFNSSIYSLHNIFDSSCSSNPNSSSQSTSSLTELDIHIAEDEEISQFMTKVTKSEPSTPSIHPGTPTDLVIPQCSYSEKTHSSAPPSPRLRHKQTTQKLITAKRPYFVYLTSSARKHSTPLFPTFIQYDNPPLPSEIKPAGMTLKILSYVVHHLRQGRIPVTRDNIHKYGLQISPEYKSICMGKTN